MCANKIEAVSGKEEAVPNAVNVLGLQDARKDTEDVLLEEPACPKQEAKNDQDDLPEGEVIGKLAVLYPENPAGSQQTLAPKDSQDTASVASDESAAKNVYFNELVESIDYHTGHKTYSALPSASITTAESAAINEALSVPKPFSSVETAAATSVGSSESRNSGSSQESNENVNPANETQSLNPSNAADAQLDDPPHQ